LSLRHKKFAFASNMGMLEIMRSRWARLQAVAVSGSTGEGLLLTALPLLAVSITTDPGEVSLVRAVGQLPWLLFSLFAGLMIDRVRRTTLLVWAYAVQVGAALALAVAGATKLLSLPLLLIVGFMVTLAQVLGDGTSGALLPEIVEADRLAAANARLQVIDQGFVRFIIPPVTGFLLAWGTGAPAWVACVMAATALALARTISSGSIAPSKAHPLRDIADGLKYLVGTPLLRAITIVVGIGSFAASAAIAILVLYATQVLHVGPVGYGVLLACMAAGWVASSFVVHRIVAWLGYSWPMRIAQCGAALTMLLIAVVPPLPLVVGAVLVLMSANTLLWNVCSQSSRQLFTPSELLGRVLTSHRALAWGLTPLGSLAGGLVGAHWGLRAVFVMAAVLQGVGALIVWRTLSPAAFTTAESSRSGQSVTT
jgi:MFS family permease